MDYKYIERLTTGPAILFLGQSYLKIDIKTDPFTSAIAKKYNGPDCDGYATILQSDISNFEETAFVWMQEKCKRITRPVAIEKIAEFPWSSIFTSAIDNIMFDVFRNNWRSFHPIYNEKYYPEDYLNRSKLHTTFLFGSIFAPEDELPPLSQIKMRMRRNTASTLLRRINDLITPLGTLIVEGYDPFTDWITMEHWLSVLEGLNPGQAHFFSITPEQARHEDLIYLVKSKKVMLHQESLAETLINAREYGILDIKNISNFKGNGPNTIFINSKAYSIPKDIWNNTIQTAEILDSTVLYPVAQLPVNKIQTEFMSFLADSSFSPKWDAYSRKFNFRRDFEEMLHELVLKQLKSNQLDNKPILLSGQAGTGKTVALRALAFDVCQMRQYPVIFIPRKNEKIVYEYIDDFCKWAEDNKAERCLIIWDGMLAPDGSYYEISRYLEQRGRKIVLVCSNYNYTVSKKAYHVIDVPSELQGQEKGRFEDHLDTIDPQINEYIRHNKLDYDSYFLVNLYRYLPSTHYNLREALFAEVKATEERLSQITISYNDDCMGFGSLEYALRKALQLEEEYLFKNKVIIVENDQLSELEQFRNLIMIPGQFGLKVPLELVLRCISKNYSQNIVDILHGMTTIKISEDEVGNITLCPRHPLEAEILVKKLGSKSEVHFVNMLISEVKQGIGYQGNNEIKFILDLIIQLAPNGKFDRKYEQCYLSIAEALKKLRTERSIENSALMLQEATLLRESLNGNNETSKLCEKDRIKRLEEAEQVLIKINELIKDDPNTKFKSAVLVELAANLGFKSTESVKLDGKIEYVQKLYKDIKKYITKAKVLDSDSVHAVNIMIWVAKDLLLSGKLNEMLSAEIKSDAYNVIQMAESENPYITQMQMYNTNKQRLYNAAGDTDLEDVVFKHLLNQKSSAGIYLRAVQMSQGLRKEGIIDEKSREGYLWIIDFIESYGSQVEYDERLKYLLLKFWWMAKVGTPFFYEERQTLPLKASDWQYLNKLISDLISTEEYKTPTLQYLNGLVAFHLNDMKKCQDIFRELRNIRFSDSRRIIRSHIASNEDGSPIKFNGTIISIQNEKNKGEVAVEGLGNITNNKVAFFPNSFNLKNIKIHDQLPEFHIAFNFLGMSADPVGMYNAFGGR